MKKRALCILLAVLLTVSVLPASASAAGGVKIDKTNFPDNTFRALIHGTYDTNGDWKLSAAELAAVTYMVVGDQGIASLKGIEFFTSVTTLDCGVNQLKTLDVSKNTKLKALYCSNNKLTALDVSKNTALEVLDCGYNKLTALDVSKNTKLKALIFPFNSVKKINVSKNTALTMLDCWANKLTSLDVSRNKKLCVLMCGNNKLQKLDVSKNTKLENLDCSNAGLTKLDISKNPKLTNLYCINNSIKTLDIGNNPYLVCTFLMGLLTYGYSLQYVLGGYDLYVDYSTRITGYQPKFTSQPKDAYVSAGNAARFTVEVRGEYLSYQWYRMYDGETGWTKLSGETDPVLVVSTSKYDTVGAKYYCGVVSTGDGVSYAAISETAELIFVKKPVITAQPKAASVKAGKSVAFKVKATGGGLQYQWFVQKKGSSAWTKLSGKTSATLKLTAKKDMNGYKYRCEVKNDCDKVYSKAVKLMVK